MISRGMLGVVAQVFPAFVISVKTDNAGTSNNDQFTLPLTTGTYDAMIHWGDGTTTHQTTDVSPTHTYASAGTYDISIVGAFPRIYFNNGGDKLKLTEIKNWGAIEWVSMDSAFYGCSNMDITAGDLPNTSAVTSFESAWRSCTGLTSFPLLDISAVTSLSQTWRNCTGLTSFPLLDTSAVTVFSFTWDGCTGLTSFPLLDTSAATSFSAPWRDCSSLMAFPLLDTSGVTSFNEAWRNCSSLTSFPLLDTSAVTVFSSAWRNCSSLTSFPLLDTSAATSFNLTFFGCTLLDVDVSAWDVASVTTATSMFENSGFSQTSYDKLLSLTTGWPSQALQDNVQFHAGSATYDDESTDIADGRALLVAATPGGFGWTITDGGAD